MPTSNYSPSILVARIRLTPSEWLYRFLLMTFTCTPIRNARATEPDLARYPFELPGILRKPDVSGLIDSFHVSTP